ncbi:hypothetical protein SBA2_80035 [Acidobacteriia bacterium SbA2]|nr:hypothetical protein SBA2_80035 [Acidobacteriia bacterium SbA2]
MDNFRLFPALLERASNPSDGAVAMAAVRERDRQNRGNGFALTPWSAAAELPPSNSAKTAAALLPHSKSESLPCS